MTTLRRCDGCKNSVEHERLPDGWRIVVMSKPPPKNTYVKMLHFCVDCQKKGKVHDGYGNPVGRLAPGFRDARPDEEG